MRRGDRSWARETRVLLLSAGTALAVAACGGGSGTYSGASIPGVSQPQQQQGQQPSAGGVPATGNNAAPAAPAPAGQAPAAGSQSANANGPAVVSRPGVPNPPVPAPPKPGLPAPPPTASNGANFASDVGVTATTITFGAINLASATRSLGPVVSEPTQKATEAAIDYINDHGGIHGRKLQLLVCDDGGDVTRARACYEKLKTQVFAFLPAETFLTDVIHPALAQDHVPFMSWGWFQSEYQDPYMFPCHANGIREAIALSKWVAENKHPKTVAIMYLNVSEDIHARDAAVQTLSKYGIKVVQTIAQEWDSPDEFEPRALDAGRQPRRDLHLHVGSTAGEVLPRRGGPELGACDGLLLQPRHHRSRFRSGVGRLHQGP